MDSKNGTGSDVEMIQVLAIQFEREFVWNPTSTALDTPRELWNDLPITVVLTENAATELLDMLAHGLGRCSCVDADHSTYTARRGPDVNH